MKFLIRARALSIDICAVCTYAGGVRGAAALYRVGRDCTSFGQTGAVSFLYLNGGSTVAVMDNPFLCGNGHHFRANAKVRARCPECGAMSRRNFDAAPTTEEKPTENKQHVPLTEPKILRQGRTRMPEKKARTPAQLANDKRLAAMHKKAAGNARPSNSSALKPRVANGLVKTRRISRPVVPTVNRRPKRTAVAGQLKSLPSPKSKSFMDQVIDTFGIKIGR